MKQNIIRMGSVRFPFLFSQPPNPFSHASFSVATAVAAGAATFAGISALTLNPKPQFWQHALTDWLFFNPIYASTTTSKQLPWASLSLAGEEASSPPDSVVESKTGMSFPSLIYQSRSLLGIGLRQKSILGLKNIHVYAFGIYAANDDVKNFLGEKYGKLSSSELKENKEFKEDIMEGEICMTVRLQIVYNKLSIRSVRNAFEESVGSRLQKFGGEDYEELLQRFTSQFKDEYKIPRGSVIELSRERGHILRTTIDGKEVGSIQSKILCRSILDLYMGEDPFDKQAKEEVESKLASLLQK